MEVQLHAKKIYENLWLEPFGEIFDEAGIDLFP